MRGHPHLHKVRLNDDSLTVAVDGYNVTEIILFVLYILSKPLALRQGESQLLILRHQRIAVGTCPRTGVLISSRLCLRARCRSASSLSAAAALLSDNRGYYLPYRFARGGGAMAAAAAGRFAGALALLKSS